MAKRYWASRDAVGSFVELGGRGGTVAQVIAVAGDARFYSLAEPPRPMFTIQRVSGGGSTLLIRTADDPGRLIPAIRGLLSGNDNPLTLMRLRTMQEGLRNSLVVSRVVSTVVLGIGVLAILLASVGLYGVVSYAMAGRAREFGIRMALGATREQIMRLVVGYGSRLALIGGTVGLILGVAATRLMGGLIHGKSSAAIAVASVTVILGTITLIASLVPARRATAVSPATSLRAE
jgi:ABC-type antimicrobial peptide transport system permease subunit